MAIRKQFPDVPLVYTGALENHPSLIEEMQAIGPLWGQTADTLRKVRDPAQWTTAMNERNIATPRTSTSPPDRSAAWLVKPLCSAGGAHVRRLSNNEAPSDDRLFQEFLPGEPCSAAFVVGASDRSVKFLGTSRMLVGEDWRASHEFGYCGSISYQPTTEEKSHWLRIGQALADDFDLVGVFGVDAIATDHGVVPIEVNPRYTASMETLEPSLAQPILRYHADACCGELLNVVETEHRRVAKLFVYADRDLVVPDSFENLLFDKQALADIPTPGQSIPAGAPITTILLTDDEPPQKLIDAANRLRKSCISLPV